MRNSFLIGQYIDTASIFHRLDPRTKLISLCIMMVGFFTLYTFVSYVLATLFVVICIRLSRISMVVLLKGLKPLWLILSFTFIYHLFFTTGDVVVSYWKIAITEQGLEQGVRIVWRIVLLVLLASLLTLTTKPLEMAQGLEQMLKPLSKFLPVEQFALMIVIAIRFIPTILEELERILLAQKARGFHIQELPWRKRLFAYIPIVIPLLFTTVQRAEQLSYAIDARGFGNGKGRTNYRVLCFKRRDVVSMSVAMSVAIVIMAMKWWGM